LDPHTGFPATYMDNDMFEFESLLGEVAVSIFVACRRFETIFCWDTNSMSHRSSEGGFGESLSDEVEEIRPLLGVGTR